VASVTTPCMLLLLFFFKESRTGGLSHLISHLSSLQNKSLLVSLKSYSSLTHLKSHPLPSFHPFVFRRPAAHSRSLHA
jgi:hypothetical protein